MSRKTLNLGILAHVDAGKTTLTERLLYTAGVIDRLGSVDSGTTLTDSLALERQRGITIKSAVASFPVADITVNLLDTPGHPDFIAEVERVLSVLDGAILVVSAVEGVQAQTQILMRTLQRLHIPTLLFINKIDRAGARFETVNHEIIRRLKLTTLPMGQVTAEGTAAADFVAYGPDDKDFVAELTERLAENDDKLLAAFIDDSAMIPYEELLEELAAQTIRGMVYPVFGGSAITGAGTDPLVTGITQLLPAIIGDADGPVSGRIFKIERGQIGEKLAYVRLFSGTVCIRDRIKFGNDKEDKVTSLVVFDQGDAIQRPSFSAGQIGKLGGLTEAQIGDILGEPTGEKSQSQFPPPTLESVVVPVHSGDRQRVRVALGQIAEQDPLINVRQDDERQEIYVSLYGEVQKEVIQSTLADDYDLAVTFRETRMIYIERPVRLASAVKILQSDDHPYPATVGLRLEPAPVDSGIEFQLDFDPRLIPIYIYKTAANFSDAMRQYIEHAFEQGLYGWRVTDCKVTMTDCAYYIGDGARKKVLPTPRTTAADFRRLTPIVLMEALEASGTVVCEPMARLHLEVPATKMGAVLAALAKLGAAVETPQLQGDLSIISSTLASAQVHSLQEQLPALTGGEGVLETEFGGYEQVKGPTPVRFLSR
jgi:ribosomal protection tetracycline resistance protein